MLIMLIRDSTGDRSWDMNPRAGITLNGGLLYVSQTPAVHREIDALLGRLPF